MNCPNPFSPVTLLVSNLISRSPLRRGFPVVLLVLGLFTLLPAASAVTPAPDGGYPNANTAEGDGALLNLTTGSSNTAIGSGALGNTTTAIFNTALGAGALGNNGADFNTAIGSFALYYNTTGTENTATGVNALLFNTTGSDNTATGIGALYKNTSGSINTANGHQALNSNTTGNENTATGFSALQDNTTGVFNTATGVTALLSNTTGNYNTAEGVNALVGNTTGSSNMAEGVNALSRNSTGTNNIAVGSKAGINLTTGSNNIDIGALGAAGESDTIRIGKRGTQNRTFIAGISGVAVTGSQVVVNSSGQLGVAASSARFKEAIKPMDKASEAILSLHPVTFRYKHELDPTAIQQFGLIAEEVEKVNPDLVARDENGKVNTVRYEAVNAMLLNEFLKEHQKVQELEKQIEALTETMQKVSEKIELNKTTPQLVADRR